MVHAGLAHPLKADDQALLLIDCPRLSDKRRRPESFADPHEFIHASLYAQPSGEEAGGEKRPSADSFSVASRLVSGHFEERARNDALVQALQTLRHRRPSPAVGNGRIIPAR